MQREFEFELVLELSDHQTTEDGWYTSTSIDRLYEAGCNDAALGMYDGVLKASFIREALTADQAVMSAVRDIHQALPGVQVSLPNEEVFEVGTIVWVMNQPAGTVFTHRSRPDKKAHLVLLTDDDDLKVPVLLWVGSKLIAPSVVGMTRAYLDGWSTCG